MMNGILTTMFIVTSPMNPNAWIQEMRTWRSEQDRTPVEQMLNNSLEDLWEEEDGSNDTTIKEELLQLQGDKDSESIRRRYYRCSDRSWIRFIKERKGKNCRS